MRKTQIDKAKAGDTIFDDGVTGLHIVIGQNVKTFFLSYYNDAGRRKKIKVGRYGIVTLDQARQIARRMLLDVAAGKDPATERAEDRKAFKPTIQDMKDEWECKLKPDLKPKTQEYFTALWENHILPKLGKKLVGELVDEDVESWHEGMSGTPTTANRALSLLRATFNVAGKKWKWQLPHGNPCSGVEKFPEKSRERYLTREELDRLCDRLEAWIAEPKSKYRRNFAYGVWLLILTGARRGEIFGLKWEWVNYEKKILDLPDSKTGAKTIKLSKWAIDILESIPKETPWVFPGKRKNEIMGGYSLSWGDLIKEANIQNLTIHDLRHSFASLAVSKGYSLETIGQMLGHAKPTTTKRYAHLMDDTRDQVSEDIADEIRNIRSKNTVVNNAVEKEALSQKIMAELLTSHPHLKGDDTAKALEGLMNDMKQIIDKHVDRLLPTPANQTEPPQHSQYIAAE